MAVAVAVHTGITALAFRALPEPVALAVAEPVRRLLLMQPKQSLGDREQTVLVVVAVVVAVRTASKVQ